MSTACHCTVDTPVGELTLVASSEGLHAILWPGEPANRIPLPQPTTHDAGHPVLATTIRQLDEYFRSERTTFDIPLAPIGTPFQLRAWDALRRIPYGETRSYGEQAATIGLRKAARAVGAANGRNPISIVVPCHRVVGSNGALTGFGGGLDTKRWLLEHERGHRPQPGQSLPLWAST